MPKKAIVDVDLTNENLESKYKEQRAIKQRQLEELQRVNQKNTQTILEARFTINTICEKLGVNFVHDEKEFKTIPYEEVSLIKVQLIFTLRYKIMTSFEENLNGIKENTTPERYEQVVKGEFDMDQFFKDTAGPYHYVGVLSEDRLSN